MNSYKFYYESDYDVDSGTFPVQSISEKSVQMDDCVAWPAVLYEFLTFLSGVYGYDIQKSVKVNGESPSVAAHEGKLAFYNEDSEEE